jgi:hypothetical protein
VSELYTEDDLRQLVVALEATPTFFGSLGELEEQTSAVLFKRHPLGAAGTVANELRGSLCSDASSVRPGSRRRAARRDPPGLGEHRRHGPRRRCHPAIGAGVSRIARSARSTERNGEHRLLQIGAKRAGWPKSPRALTGRLRQAQTLLRTLGIERVFGREGALKCGQKLALK